MKFFRYLASLFVPTKMGQRKNISVIVSLIILLLASYVLAIPYMVTFEKMAYEVYCDYESYNFKVFDEEYSKEVPFTEEEKEKFGDKYILTTFDEIKKLDFKIAGGQVAIPSGVKDLKEIPYNGKEYIVKREVYYFDNEGTKLDDFDTFYIHIVFDIFVDSKDATYAYRDDFDKKLDFSNEDHYLLAFYIDGFIYRNEFMIDNNRQSYGMKYYDVNIDFKEINNISDLAKGLTQMLIPETKTAYTFNSFLYCVIAPLIIAFGGYALFRKNNELVTYKHFFNIAALSSIPVLILFFILEWIPFMISIGIMELYWVALAIYYVIVLKIIDKTPRME